MSVSFAKVAQCSTTVAGTNYYSAYAPPTATPTSGGSLTGQDVSDYFIEVFFTKPYLDAHTLSYPSWRYAYIFWFVLIALFVVWTVLHQLHWKLGFIGAYVRKVGIRKLNWSGSRKPRSSASDAAERTRFPVNAAATASPQKRRLFGSGNGMTISQIFGLLVLLAFTFVMCYVGPDFVNPLECMFGGPCAFHPVNGDNATNQLSRKRALFVAFEEAFATAGRLTKRRLTRYGWSPLTDPLLFGPNYTIDKGWWESGNRVGLIAYAFLPLSVGLALKQWPMNPFASPFFTNIGADKTLFWHRWVGRLVWILSTVHAALWMKQLFIDISPFNDPVWYVAWRWHRLVAGGVAYVFLTIMFLLSFRPFRDRFYEIFYYSHVSLTIGFLVGIIIHYQALQGWGLLAAGLWGLERLVRFTIYLYLNYGLGIPVFGEGPIGKSQFTSRGARASAFKVHHVEKRLSAEGQKYAGLHGGPYGNEEWSAASQSTQNLRDTSHVHPSALPPRRAVHEYGQDDSPALPYGAGPYSPSKPLMAPASAAHQPSALSPGAARRSHQAIPRGYALAQILPGKVIRLTLRTPRHLSWKPGQHLQLTIPSVRWWESHPYTICNSQDMTEGFQDEPAGGNSLGSEISLLLSVRRGFTKHLYNSVVQKRKRLVALQPPCPTPAGAQDPSIPAHSGGLLIRAQTYLPAGSAVRARWDDHSTAILVAAGSGITYTMAVLEHLCFAMANKDAALRGQEPGWAQSSAKSTSKKPQRAKPTNVSRVRFVWIFREYAHLSWIAPALRRCLDISDPARLRVDLFVTRDAGPGSIQRPFAPAAALPYNSSTLMQEAKESSIFQPPRPSFAQGHRRTSSADSSASDLSQTVVGDKEYTHAPGYRKHSRGFEDVALAPGHHRQQELAEQTQREDEDAAAADFSVTDMILFDGEEDTSLSAAEQAVSTTVRKEGKLRRALSRKQTKTRFKASESEQQLMPLSQSQFQEELGSSGPAPDPHHQQGQHESRRGVLPHQYPPANTSRGSSFSYDADKVGYDESPIATPRLHEYERRGSAPAVSLLDDTTNGESFDMDEQDKEDLKIIAELARGGRPDLDGILDTEIERSQGSVIVGCCGPPALTNLIRNMVSKRINPARMRRGDARGNIELIAEDFTN